MTAHADIPAGSLSVDALDYALPEDLIATRPAARRDAARMLVYRVEVDQVEHRTVGDLPDMLDEGDTLITNDTTVLPARFRGRREATGGRLDGLFLAEDDAPGVWRVMLRGAGGLPSGTRIEIADPAGEPAVVLELLETVTGGTWRVRAHHNEANAAAALDRVGLTPLPPYILGARRRDGLDVDDHADRDRYQTVYADRERSGSVAAPTAGLHFTPALLDALEASGVDRRTVTLHVGIGTFRPITAATIGEHDMHEEWYHVPAETTARLEARRDGAPGRIVAVGTTSVRAIESLPEPLPVGAVDGSTRLLLAPPARMRRVDALLTNFHLPRSTLLALVATMTGVERLIELYEEAIAHEYRFYSYGDAMLILP